MGLTSVALTFQQWGLCLPGFYTAFLLVSKPFCHHQPGLSRSLRLLKRIVEKKHVLRAQRRQIAPIFAHLQRPTGISVGDGPSEPWLWDQVLIISLVEWSFHPKKCTYCVSSTRRPWERQEGIYKEFQGVFSQGVWGLLVWLELGDVVLNKSTRT